MLRFLCTVLIFLSVSESVRAGEIQVGVLVGTSQRSTFDHTFKRFTKETGIAVRTIPSQDTAYKAKVPIWLLDGHGTPDVIFWQASQRLFAYTSKNAVHPITSLWTEEKLDANFSHVKSGVAQNGEVYALPVSYYHWGLYYKKSVVEKFGGVPKDWAAFMEQCQRMKDAGITPIGIGRKDKWPAAAWFDYLNLRLNGLSFHQELLAGKITFTDARVQRVLVEWKKLIDADFFSPNRADEGWDDVLPYMYRDRVAYTLVGNFVTSKIPSTLYQDFGFTPFPSIGKSERYEEAPLDVLLIPKKAKNIKGAEAFIRFMARADVQSSLNADLGYLPPHRQGIASPKAFTQAGVDLLRQSKGVSQYFDRDSPPEFEKLAIPLLAEFTVYADVAGLTSRLEAARKSVFP
ncbi:MAG: hypothetical protein CFE44_01060 [Burkholderiales bacterium PBB4]|nr:MAG: hypothetical protein CFE44_01060 [Burkholderiales bacterium PBB4]